MTSSSGAGAVAEIQDSSDAVSGKRGDAVAAAFIRGQEVCGHSIRCS